MPYLHNKETEGEIVFANETIGPWVVICHSDAEGSEWETEVKLTVSDEGRVTVVDQDWSSDYADEVRDWNGNYTTVEEGFGWNEIFQVLWSQHELNVLAQGRLRTQETSQDGLVSLLREVTS